MNFKFSAVFYSTVPAVLVFILINSAAEYLCLRFTGISIIHEFQEISQMPFGTTFHVLNFCMFAFEMHLVMLFYALIKPLFPSLLKPIFITVFFFLLFIALFLGQMVNLGIYPLNVALVFLTASIAAFPGAVFSGAVIYNRIASNRTS